MSSLHDRNQNVALMTSVIILRYFHKECINHEL